MARVLSGFVLLSLIAAPAAPSAAVSIDGPWHVQMLQDLGGAPGPDLSTPCHWDVVQAGTSLTASYVCPSLDPVGGTYTGTIDPDAGTFEISEPAPFCVDNGGVAALHGTIAPDSSSFTASASCLSFATITFIASRCRNGVVDAGEACDQGIDQPGDCCSSTCQLLPSGTICGGDDGDGEACTGFTCDGAAGACPATVGNLPAGTRCGETSGCVYPVCDGAGGCTSTDTLDDGHACAGQCRKGQGTCAAGVCSAPLLPAGTPCEADPNPCTIDSCDPSGACAVGSCSACCDSSGGGCTPAYDATCEHSTVARSRVTLARKTGAIAWAWPKGDETDFGAPESSGAAVCVYADDAPALIAIAEAKTGMCGGKPCWTRSAGRLRYKGAKGDRLRSLALREGDDGRAGIAAKAKGVPFLHWQAFPSLALSTPVRVQLRIADRCWESTFTAGRKNTLWLFNASGGSPSGAFVDGRESGF